MGCEWRCRRVLSCLSQEKENLSALERKYADLTGGRSFTLREVGSSAGWPFFPFKAPQDSGGGDGCGPFFFFFFQTGGVSPSSASPGSVLIGRRLSVLQGSPARRRSSSSSSLGRLVRSLVPLFLCRSQEGRGTFFSRCSFSLLRLVCPADPCMSCPSFPLCP